MKFLISLLSIILLFSCASSSDFKAHQAQANQEFNKIKTLNLELERTKNKLNEEVDKLLTELKSNEAKILKQEKKFALELDTQMKASNLVFNSYQQNIGEQVNSLKKTIENDINRFNKVEQRIKEFNNLLTINKEEFIKWVNLEKSIAEKRIRSINETLVNLYSKEIIQTSTKNTKTTEKKDEKNSKTTETKEKKDTKTTEKEL